MMENFVAELRKIISFKDATTVGDIVVVASHEPRMLVYGLVTGIKPDTIKKGWWNVTLQLLAVPPREVIWTLRAPQFSGQEIFTFGGIPHFIQAVRFESAPVPAGEPMGDGAMKKGGAAKGGIRRVK